MEVKKSRTRVSGSAKSRDELPRKARIGARGEQNRLGTLSYASDTLTASQTGRLPVHEVIGFVSAVFCSPQEGLESRLMELMNLF